MAQGGRLLYRSPPRLRALGLEEVGERGGGTWLASAVPAALSPGCGAVSPLSKCNKFNKAPLLPLAQATPKDTLLPGDPRWELMHCQSCRLEWPEGHPSQDAQCAPRKGNLSFSPWPPPPWSRAHTHRPTRVRVHRRGRPPGLRPHLGRPAGKDGPGRGSPNSGDSRALHPGPLPPHTPAPAPRDSRADPRRSRSRRPPSVSTPSVAARFASL